jgi:hypothetical protein
VIAIGSDKSISKIEKTRKERSVKSNVSDERPKRLKSSNKTVGIDNLK